MFIVFMLIGPGLLLYLYAQSKLNPPKPTEPPTEPLAIPYPE